MNKKIALLPLLALIITGCSGGSSTISPSSSTSTPSSSSTSSESSSSSESEASSSESESSSSSSVSSSSSSSESSSSSSSSGINYKEFYMQNLGDFEKFTSVIQGLGTLPIKGYQYTKDEDNSYNDRYYTYETILNDSEILRTEKVEDYENETSWNIVHYNGIHSDMYYEVNDRVTFEESSASRKAIVTNVASEELTPDQILLEDATSKIATEQEKYNLSYIYSTLWSLIFSATQTRYLALVEGDTCNIIINAYQKLSDVNYYTLNATFNEDLLLVSGTLLTKSYESHNWDDASNEPYDEYLTVNKVETAITQITYGALDTAGTNPLVKLDPYFVNEITSNFSFNLSNEAGLVEDLHMISGSWLTKTIIKNGLRNTSSYSPATAIDLDSIRILSSSNQEVLTSHSDGSLQAGIAGTSDVTIGNAFVSHTFTVTVSEIEEEENNDPIVSNGNHWGVVAESDSYDKSCMQITLVGTGAHYIYVLTENPGPFVDAHLNENISCSVQIWAGSGYKNTTSYGTMTVAENQAELCEQYEVAAGLFFVYEVTRPSADLRINIRVGEATNFANLVTTR